jgi:hypothetical protein
MTKRRIYQLIVTIIALFAVMGALFVGMTALVQLRTEQDNVQTSRYEATVAACESRNEQNQTLIDFMLALVTEDTPRSRAFIKRVNETFVIVDNCQARARKTVSVK